VIGYITLGTSDLKRAATFYDALLAEVGAKRYMESEKFVAWAVSLGAKDEGAPGPIFLQGDHTAIDYRNIVLTPARRD